MWQKIKDFIFEKDGNFVVTNIPKRQDDLRSEGYEVFQRNIECYQRAVAHYCEICDKGFKTIGATGAHKRLKHGK